MAESGGRAASDGRFCDLVDEARDAFGRGGWLVEPLQRIEHVAGSQLRPQQRERVGAGDGIEADVAADREHRSALSGHEGKRFLEFLEPLAVRCKRVAVGTGWRVDTHPMLFLADLAPDLVLRDAMGERLIGEQLGFAAAQVGVRDVRGRVEDGGVAVPPALLHAGDGDRQLCTSADQDRDVEDPVLLGTNELFAVVEQHARIERVDDRELGHRAGIRGLGDHEATRQRLVERDVVGNRVAGREEGCDDDAAVLDRIAEPKGRGRGDQRMAPLVCARESRGVAAALTTELATSVAAHRTRQRRCQRRGQRRSRRGRFRFALKACGLSEGWPCDPSARSCVE